MPPRPQPPPRRHARVLLLEKRDVLGGSSVRSAGLCAYADTDEQRAAGVRDSADLLRRDLLEVGRHRADEALVDRYCAEQAGTYRWLRSHGAVFGAPRAASGQSVPRSHPVDVAALIDELVRRARSRGAQVRYRSRATRLVMSGEHVEGVVVEGPDGRRHTVAAADRGDRHRRFRAQREAARRVRAANGAGAEGRWGGRTPATGC